MSFILDALRKSDARRQQSAAPGLNTPEPPRPPRRRRRLAPMLLLAFVVVGAAAASLVWLRPQWLPPGWIGAGEGAPEIADGTPRQVEETLAGESPDLGRENAAIGERMMEERGTGSGSDRGRMPPEPSEPATTADSGANQNQSQNRNRRVPVPASPSRVVRREPAEPRESEPVKATDATAELERRMAAEAARRRQVREQQGDDRAGTPPEPREARPETAAIPPEQGGDDPSDAPAGNAMRPLNEGVAEYVRVWELPLSVRRNLPELGVSIHVFTPEPAQRFVLINGERYTAGDSIGEARIVEIRREGAIVDFRSHRFLLEPR